MSREKKEKMVSKMVREFMWDVLSVVYCVIGWEVDIVKDLWS